MLRDPKVQLNVIVHIFSHQAAPHQPIRHFNTSSAPTMEENSHAARNIAHESDIQMKVMKSDKRLIRAVVFKAFRERLSDLLFVHISSGLLF